MSVIISRLPECYPFSIPLLHSINHPNLPRDFNKLSTQLQWDAVAALPTNTMSAVAASFLCCRVPVQVPCSAAVVLDLAVAGYIRALNFRALSEFIKFCTRSHTIHERYYLTNQTPLQVVQNKRYCKFLSQSSPHASLPKLSADKQLHIFPFKATADSQSKLNLWFSDVVQSISCYFPTAYAFLEQNRAVFYNLAPLYNDQASAIMIYYIALAGNTANYTYLLIAVAAVIVPKAAKALSLVLKAVGAQTSLIGAMLCEAQTLTGRGVGECDLLTEARYRCDPTAVAEKVFSVDPEKLRPYVRQIISEELADTNVVFPSMDDFWHSRWKWCVNGSHSSVLGRVDPRFDVKVPKSQQVHRRCVVEKLKEEPVSTWNGNAYFSGSLKLEHGKLRALFACDTLTYFAFEHLLRPVEKAWHGWRVLLDPGHGGQVNIVRRIRNLQQSGVYNVMLDYEDFNSQHSIRSQQVLFEELIDVVGYDKQLGKNIIESFAKQDVYVGGKRVGRMAGTLCSGHRATTFVNSVLNAAYIAYVMGGYDSYRSMHVGDDVYIACPTATSASILVEAVGRSGLRVNPTKQSVGTFVAEFLRMAVCQKHTVGYVARSISSAISGNWLTQHKQSPAEFMRTMVAHAWTLGNRAKYPRLGLTLVHALCRITGLKRGRMMRLLVGDTALGSGPCRGCRDYYSVASVVEDRHSNLHTMDYYMILDELPSYASTDFLTHCASPIERQALQMTGLSLEDAMKEASYAKTLSSSDKVNDYKVSVTLNYVSYAVRRAVPLDVLIREHEHNCAANDVGVLLHYPLIANIRNYLNQPWTIALLEELGCYDSSKDIQITAWGYEPHPVMVDGYLPYNDAVSYSAGVSAELVRVHYPIMM